MASVVELNCYPIKGCAGVSLSDALLTPAGLEHDRSFMVTTTDGVFRSQRKDPLLARIRPELGANGAWMTLRADGVEPVTVDVDTSGRRVNVELFTVPFLGIDQGEQVAQWLSEVLGTPSRLVRVPPEHDRVTIGWRNGTAGYADSGPLLLTALSSLDLLNDRIVEYGGEPLPMNRFRANIVVDGWETPHTEDEIRRFTVGAAALDYAKLAIRCAVTLVDQRTGEKVGPEPLRTLAGYRRATQGGVAFGTKFAAARTGKLSVGDALTVTEWGPSEL